MSVIVQIIVQYGETLLTCDSQCSSVGMSVITTFMQMEISTLG